MRDREIHQLINQLINGDAAIGKYYQHEAIPRDFAVWAILSWEGTCGHTDRESCNYLIVTIFNIAVGDKMNKRESDPGIKQIPPFLPIHASRF